MSNLAVVPQSPALAMKEEELLPVLKSSLYPGAQDASIKLVVGYCRAAGLDPMQKPVHIVPMKVKQKTDKGKDEYVWRDVIMPGVGLYRTQAARSGALAGISEPEFGPTATLHYKKKVWDDDGPERSSRTVDATLEYPEWCRVTVKRMLAGGQIAEFTAIEYWLENYATAGANTDAPNAMWTKRQRGQLAKCTQAQALRMGFPEMTGSAPTADEMEGKVVDDGNTFDGEPAGKPPVAPPQRKSATAEKVPDPRKMPHPEHAEPPPVMEPVGDTTEPPAATGRAPEPQQGDPATTNELAYLKRKFTEAGLDLLAQCNERGWNSQLLTKNQWATLKSLAIDTINAKG